MRDPALIVAGALALSLAAPAYAQVRAEPSVRVVVSDVVVLGGPGSSPHRQTTPEVVVARLMSFDQDRDGRVTRAELPERMQGLLNEASSDEGLDARDVRRIAQQPRFTLAPSGLEPGRYGFGEDNGFDTRLHIEGAIDDLRLAGARRKEAVTVARAFIEKARMRATRNLVTTARSSLNAEQFAAFKALLDSPALSGVMSVLVREGGPSLEATIAHAQAARRQSQLAALVSGFKLLPDARRRMAAALDQFKPHDRLGDADRVALITELRSVLTARERDDLRAALERRPIVKQATSQMADIGTLSGVSGVASVVR